MAILSFRMSRAVTSATDDRGRPTRSFSGQRSRRFDGTVHSANSAVVDGGGGHGAAKFAAPS